MLWCPLGLMSTWLFLSNYPCIHFKWDRSDGQGVHTPNHMAYSNMVSKLQASLLCLDVEDLWTRDFRSSLSYTNWWSKLTWKIRLKFLPSSQHSLGQAPFSCITYANPPYASSTNDNTPANCKLVKWILWMIFTRFALYCTPAVLSWQVVGQSDLTVSSGTYYGQLDPSLL